MKLLLTSNGLSNQSIADALFELVEKPAGETSIAFVPTAMNVSLGDKSWFVNDLWNIKKTEIKFLDVVDISALPQKIWLPRLEAADVLFFSGGHSSHLMRHIKESGLKTLLPGLLKTKVYAGISAGSIVTNPSLAVSNTDKKIYYEKQFGYSSEEALNFVPFYTRPHFNSPDFPQAHEEILKQIASEKHITIYGIDDRSALKVIDGQVQIVSEGDVVKF